MEEFVLHILKLNIIGAVIVLLVKVMSVFLKGKFTAQWKYFVWLMLSLSLLLPVPMPKCISLVRIQVSQIPATPPDEPIQTGQASAEERHTVQTSADTDQSMQDDPLLNTEGVSSASSMASPARESGLGIFSGNKPFIIFLVLWIGIAIIKLICEGIAYRISISSLKRMSIPVYNPMTVRMYSSVCQTRGIQRPPRLMQNAALSTPLLTGFLHSELYLPAVGYTAEELKLIFHHELSHYSYKDLWYKMLLRFCATVYWFNPFLLLMLKEAENDIENLCDTRVIRYCSSNDHKLYRRLLLKTVAIENHIPYVTASLNDSTLVFKDRILYMVHLKKLQKNILPGILLTALLFLTNSVFALSMSAEHTDAPAQSNAAYDQGTEAAAKAPQPETVSIEHTKYTMYTMDSVNIRSLPSLGGAIIRNLPVGSAVTITGRSQKGWLPVSFQDISGYINEQYLTASREEAAAAAKAWADAQATADAQTTTDAHSADDTNADDGSISTPVSTPDEDNSYNGGTDNGGFQDDSPEPDEGDVPPEEQSGDYNVSDPYDLYSWDSGSNSYIPFQQAEGDASPIGRGNGWYYYNSVTGAYEPW